MLLPIRAYGVVAALLSLAAQSTHVSAQAAAVQVRGVAFDALRNQPLRDARITLVGGTRIATTDARGRFTFDSVAPGEYTFAMQHAALDSLGFNGLSTRAKITNGGAEVRLTVPNFATLWRAACGGPVPQNLGFIYGTVRDASTMRPVRDAAIEVSWSDMVLREKGRAQEVVRRVSHRDARTDSTGSYAVCGIAPEHWVRLHATTDTTESGFLDLAPNDVRLQRRDLLIGAAQDSTRRGFVAGLVTDATGRAFPEARVVLDSVTEVRTGEDGRFVLRGVPTGTRQLEVLSVGMVPMTPIVDVTAHDTASVAVQFSPPVTLDGMKVVAGRTGRVMADEFTLRRKIGAGYTMDSTEVAKFSNLPALFQGVPSLTVEYRRPNFTISMPKGTGRCVPDIRLDGVEAGFGHLADLAPAEVAGVEIYNRALIVPAQFARAGHPPECGMILVWTKYGFRNR